MNWILTNWKLMLIVTAALFVTWAFTPSCATRKGSQAAIEAQQAKEQAKQHEGRANAAEDAAREATTRYLSIQAERDALARDKAKLKAEVVVLTSKLAPRPPLPNGATGVPVASPGMGQSERDAWTLAVDTRDALIAEQGQLIAKHEEDDAKAELFLASLKASEESWKRAAMEQGARSRELDKALALKEIEARVMKSAHTKTRVRDALIVAAVTFLGCRQIK
jgi:hypothetical protein